MTVQQHTRRSISELGQEIYEKSLREKLETDHQDEYLLIHVDTEDYELDPDCMAASQRAMARHGDGRWYMIRIGHSAAARIGWWPGPQS